MMFIFVEYNTLKEKCYFYNKIYNKEGEKRREKKIDIIHDVIKRDRKKKY